MLKSSRQVQLNEVARWELIKMGTFLQLFAFHSGLNVSLSTVYIIKAEMFNNCILFLVYQHCSVCMGLYNCLSCRYISSGNAIMDIAKDFRVGLETAREAIHLTLRVLWEELEPRYMKVCIGLQKENFGLELRAYTASAFITLNQSP